MENFFLNGKNLCYFFLKSSTAAGFYFGTIVDFSLKSIFMTDIFAQRIFIVDNDLFSLTINKQVLKNLGCTDVTKFDNEIDFFRKLHEQPRVVLLDYRTNPQKGLDVLKAIKELQSEIYVVFITGPSGVIEALYSLNYGAFEYIIKDKKYAAVVEMVMNNMQQMEMLIYKNPGRK